MQALKDSSAWQAKGPRIRFSMIITWADFLMSNCYPCGCWVEVENLRL